MRTAARIGNRLLELAMVGIAVLVIASGDPSLCLVLWDIVGVIYVAIRVLRLVRKRDAETPADWYDDETGGWWGLVFTMLTSGVGLVAVVTIVAVNHSQQFETLDKGTSAAAALLAWLILHFGYAEHYALLYHRQLPNRILSFPNTENPNLADFTYFSFTIGVSFSVSDVNTQTRGIRLQLMTHAVISFLYNATVIGVAVGEMTGGR